MHVLVLGAGLLGVSTAHFLQQQGHTVTVGDRQATAAAETSFANGGQISVSQSEPWANPGTPMRALKWMSHEDAPLLFRPRLEWEQWYWGFRFLRECLPGRTLRNTLAIANLATYSRRELQALKTATGIQFASSEAGILHLFQSRQDFKHVPARQKELEAMGIRTRTLTPDEATALGWEEIRLAGDALRLDDSRARVAGGVLSGAIRAALIAEGEGSRSVDTAFTQATEAFKAAETLTDEWQPYARLLRREYEFAPLVELALRAWT